MLIELKDIQEVRPVGSNISLDRVLPYIDEVEQLTVVPLLPTGLYSRLASAPDDPENAFILDGGVRNEGSADEVRLVGLKKAIALLAYARIVVNNQANVTPLGIRVKESNFSEDAPDKLLFRVANQAEATGKVYLQQVVDYLNAEGCTQKSVSRPKFTVIGQ